MKGLIVCGSRSGDWDKAVGPFLTGTHWKIDLVADICSCHRNPFETVFLAWRILTQKFDFVVCVGGKAFALPGVLDSWIWFLSKIFFKKPVLVIGVALGDPGSRALLAADYSIVEIPGQPVLLADKDHAYTGIEGLSAVLFMAEEDRLPKEQKPRTEKSAEQEIWKNF